MDFFFADNPWVLLFLPLLIFWLIFEGGFKLGRHQSGSIDDATKSWIASVEQMILLVLSLLLAFSFGIAEQRFDARKQLVVDEANAIGTTYLRSQWLAEPRRNEVARLLGRYVDLRLPADMSTVDRALPKMLAESDRLQSQLWSHAIAIAQEQPGSPVAALFISTLNDMIDLQSKRLAAFHNRVPEIILWLLYVFAAFAVFITGYVAAFGNRKSTVALVPMIGVLALALWIIVDLDRSQQGFMKINQDSMQRLQQQMKMDAAAVK